MSKQKRPKTPKQVERDLGIESGWRCAIPHCRQTDSLEIVHIKAHADGGLSEFNNLIMLCRNCHYKYDSKKIKSMDKKAITQVKHNLQILNGRYSSYELRLLQYFLDTNIKEILLFGRDVDVSFLVRDGLLEISLQRLQNSINFPPTKFLLTKKGALFIKNMKNCKKI